MQQCGREKALVIECWALTQEEVEKSNALQKKGLLHLSRHLMKFLHCCEPPAPPPQNTHTYKPCHTSVQIHMLTLQLYHEPVACSHITQDESSWKETGPEKPLFVGQNCTPVICLSTGEAGRMVDSSISYGGISSFDTIMRATLQPSHIKKKIKVGRKWIEGSVGLLAWRYRRDPHDWCPFPHHYSNSHGCNWLNWAIDFILAASFHPTN